MHEVVPSYHVPHTYDRQNICKVFFYNTLFNWPARNWWALISSWDFFTSIFMEFFSKERNQFRLLSLSATMQKSAGSSYHKTTFINPFFSFLSPHPLCPLWLRTASTWASWCRHCCCSDSKPHWTTKQAGTRTLNWMVRPALWPDCDWGDRGPERDFLKNKKRRPHPRAPSMMMRERGRKSFLNGERKKGRSFAQKGAQKLRTDRDTVRQNLCPYAIRINFIRW